LKGLLKKDRLLEINDGLKGIYKKVRVHVQSDYLSPSGNLIKSHHSYPRRLHMSQYNRTLISLLWQKGFSLVLSNQLLIILFCLLIFNRQAVATPQPEIIVPQLFSYYATSNTEKEILIIAKIPVESGFVPSPDYAMKIRVETSVWPGDESQLLEETTTHLAGMFANHVFKVPHGQWSVKAQLTGPTEGPWSDNIRFSVVTPDHISQKTKAPYVIQPKEEVVYYLPAKVPIKVRHYPDPDPYYCLQFYYEISKNPGGPWKEDMKFSGDGIPSVNGVRVGSLHVDEEYYFRITFRNSEDEAEFSQWRHFRTKKDAPGCTTIFQPDDWSPVHFSPINVEIHHLGVDAYSMFHVYLGYSTNKDGPYQTVPDAELENLTTNGEVTTATLKLPQYGYYRARVWFTPPGGTKPDCKAESTYFRYSELITGISNSSSSLTMKPKIQPKNLTTAPKPSVKLKNFPTK
jgi:hypothetical protein